MKVLELSEDPNKNIIAFRGTVPQGEEIHRHRTLAPCSFLNATDDCGKLHQRFQEGFLSLINQCHDTILSLKGREVSVTGHSLGGSLALFMGPKLFYDYHILPKHVYAFAGKRMLLKVVGMRGDTRYSRVNRAYCAEKVIVNGKAALA